MENKLKVYRASAGSGKTFTLTVEYIKLLVENPENYKHILAVTFTNKATTEMKERIIGTLAAIKSRDASANNYIDKIQEKFKEEGKDVNNEVIIENADKALTMILHDYSHFRIETIDSFFQSIIRELAHELKLNANLKVDLNFEDALDEAVKLMLENLDDDPEAKAVVWSYVKENIDRGNDWHIEKAVKDFSKNIFNENYLSHEKEIKSKGFNSKWYSHYKSNLYKIKEAENAKILDVAKEFIDKCKEIGLGIDDFNGGKVRGAYAFVEKILSGKTPEAKSKDEWLEGNLLKKGIVSNDIWDIVDILKRLFDTQEKAIHKVNSVDAILKHLNQMMLLNKVDKNLRQLNDDNNRFLLADTAHLLNELIGQSDIPFIYEKTGTQFHYIMIDEFQDTSSLQWANFLPLILNSLSDGNMCLIVGDVKQSIYRWRNGEWKILNNINTSPELKNHIAEDPKAMCTNYRSAGEVIKFNNQVFTDAIAILKQQYLSKCNCTEEEAPIVKQIDNAYSNVVQNITEKNEGRGYVCVEEVEGDDLTAEALSKTKDAIISLREKGIKDSDIAILTRTGKEVQSVCQYLTTEIPDAKIISNEAFMLESSDAVTLLIYALQTIGNTENLFNLATLAYKYQTMVEGNDMDINQFMPSDIDSILKYLPQSFGNRLGELSAMPLNELCEELYNILNLSRIENQDAYLLYFFDELANYSKDQTANAGDFVNYWYEKLHEATIPNGSSEGIKVMTIHKSKGLEFHSVIIPFCTWNMDGKNGFIWCSLDDKEEPYKGLTFTAISYQKDIQNSAFRQEYEEELLMNYVDNFNIMYVAFTRAKENLFVFTSKQSGFTCYDILKGTSLTEDNATKYEAGELVGRNEIEDNDKRQTDASQKDINIKFGSNHLMASFMQSNKSKEFVIDEDEELEDKRDLYIKEGLLVHKILENVHGINDIDKSIRQMECEGNFINASYRDEVKSLILNAFKNERIKDWFDSKWTVINECNIIYKDNDGIIREKRPDRVITDGHNTLVIDYKTGKPNTIAHQEQIRRYMELLSEMGYMNVKGYLWYLRRNDIEEVKL